MASSSFRYDVFPSFSGQDVRQSFLSNLLKELHRKSIETFIDNRIERSLPIAPELLLAIKESKISIVIFSINYASSTWCLNELVEIHKCFKELKQMVIPIFYNVVPSDVGKQTGEFGKLFEETCKGKPEDHKQSWMQALIDVAKIAGYVLLNGMEKVVLRAFVAFSEWSNTYKRGQGATVPPTMALPDSRALNVENDDVALSWVVGVVAAHFFFV